MNRLFFVLIAMILLMAVQLFAIDHLDLLTTMYGEFNGSWFGDRVIAMDYNGDGYDDLIAYSPYWNPDGIYNNMQMWGKIYFYWGGTILDNVPDFVIAGTYNREYGRRMIENGGDINGDGIDDLVISVVIENMPFIATFYGTASPHINPDLLIPINEMADAAVIPSPLGDINGDGCDDLAIWISPFDGTRDKLVIWTGTNNELTLLAVNYNTAVAFTATGLGDVNGDEIDDFIFQQGIANDPYNYSRIVLYYGDTNFPAVDSLVISANTNSITIRSSSPLGDLNGDGYSDFESITGKMWFGGSSIDSNYNIILQYNTQYHEWTNPGYNRGLPFIYGDLNGDGYDDIIGSDYNVGYYDGEVGIWVGKPNMDGLRDLYIAPSSDYMHRNFGWSKAAGDFNGDGLCDLAVSAPMYYSAPQWAEGRVYVYSGNSALSDPIVAVDDPITPYLDDNLWEFNVYPNPFNPSTTIAFSIPQTGKVKLCVYNIKGQKVKEVLNTGMEKGFHKIVWDGRDRNNRSVSSGMYFFRLESGGQTSVRKAMLMK